MHELMVEVGNETRGNRMLLASTTNDLAKQQIREFSDILYANESLRPYRIIETRDGYLGLAPEGVEANDLVCILDNFQYPVILRETAEGFSFVGVSFVLGLMKGEANQKWGGGNLRPEVFAIS